MSGGLLKNICNSLFSILLLAELQIVRKRVIRIRVEDRRLRVRSRGTERSGVPK